VSWRDPPDHGDWMLFAMVFVTVQVWLWVLWLWVR
jgi:hypothetical protein